MSEGEKKKRRREKKEKERNRNRRSSVFYYKSKILYIIFYIFNVILCYTDYTPWSFLFILKAL